MAWPNHLKRTLPCIEGITLAIVLLIIFILGVVQLSLGLVVISEFDEHANNSQIMRWPQHSPTGVYHSLSARPEHLITKPTTFIVVEGALSTGVVCLFLLSFAVHDHTKGKEYGPKITVSTLTNSIEVPPYLTSY